MSSMEREKENLTKLRRKNFQFNRKIQATRVADHAASSGKIINEVAQVTKWPRGGDEQE